MQKQAPTYNETCSFTNVHKSHAHTKRKILHFIPINMLYNQLRFSKRNKMGWEEVWVKNKIKDLLLSLTSEFHSWNLHSRRREMTPTS